MAEVIEGNGGLPKVRITSPATVGEMYLHGAHVTSWKPRGREEVLFVSSQSHWEQGRAIRGGVPVCFPWFGDKPGDYERAGARLGAHETVAA
jgi:glucose-6-phosphate 1-epimerase